MDINGESFAERHFLYRRMQHCSYNTCKFCFLQKADHLSIEKEERRLLPLDMQVEEEEEDLALFSKYGVLVASIL